MANSNSTNDVELVISKTSDEQSKSFQTTLKDFQALLDANKLEDVVLKNVLSIYHTLETLHKEKKINSQEFKQRTESLFNIVQLLEDVHNIHTK